ncbi:hypothetical protein KGM_210574 [Danaus plexippus plexippus]|uniref:NAD(+) kinase n=1 Tax=Danaus plexippus plexippus TaxID=278856 RepID=A0A212EID7_DANPL|nr:hypothetical protein KGM_210574 [Danaus plexippus plexippus]
MSVLNNFTVSIAKGLRRLRHNKELCGHGSISRKENTRLKMEKCLIVSKVTRYEYERHMHDNIADSDLEVILRKRGSDFDSMIETHRQQKAFEENVASSLKSMGLQVEMASRLTYNDELIKWCDVVVPCGGDGTFLLAASRVRDATKPVIGFNSAPHKSVGRLCLPTWCSNDVKGAFTALKEVFIGESVTSRVSLLRLQIDNGQWTHTKSSGLCVTTGTGSTSWHYSINCLRTHSVLELMQILNEDFDVKMDTTLEKAREVAERYNQKLMFPPDSAYLAYSVREYITFEEWPAPRGLRVRDRAGCVRVKSHCSDAGLVIDGSVSFPFNDGTKALLEVYPEDSLMTVQMDDSLPY